jgi:hypothetical protein
MLFKFQKNEGKIQVTLKKFETFHGYSLKTKHFSVFSILCES